MTDQRWSLGSVFPASPLGSRVLQEAQESVQHSRAGHQREHQEHPEGSTRAATAILSGQVEGGRWVPCGVAGPAGLEDGDGQAEPAESLQQGAPAVVLGPDRPGLPVVVHRVLLVRVLAGRWRLGRAGSGWRLGPGQRGPPARSRAARRWRQPCRPVWAPCPERRTSWRSCVGLHGVDGRLEPGRRT